MATASDNDLLQDIQLIKQALLIFLDGANGDLMRMMAFSEVMQSPGLVKVILERQAAIQALIQEFKGEVPSGSTDK